MTQPGPLSTLLRAFTALLLLHLAGSTQLRPWQQTTGQQGDAPVVAIAAAPAAAALRTGERLPLGGRGLGHGPEGGPPALLPPTVPRAVAPLPRHLAQRFDGEMRARARLARPRPPVRAPPV